MHAAPTAKFFVRRGRYKVKVRSHPVPRFQCRTCGKGFSRQTFRPDYHDKKPHLNRRVMECLRAGLSQRQAARKLSITRSNLARKVRKIQRAMGALAVEPIKRAPTCRPLGDLEAGALVRGSDLPGRPANHQSDTVPLATGS